MEWTTLLSYLSTKNLMALLDKYESLGPLPGILSTFVEAFLPMLPLIAIVAGNAAAYGLWLGFLYSWLGASAGAILVFLLCRKLARHRFMSFLTQHPKVNYSMDWMNRHGFSAIFLLCCFPFSPSSLINVVAALSKVSTVQFAAAILASKAIMIFMISFIGHDLASFIREPWRLLLVFAAVLGLWYAGKKVESRFAVKQ
ncbi:TVP38/TMEM64 family protein [Aneurinibacillus tyrosinisolvens]|uniref:TVP38/TMEM64 family protein n=1 Tax=Aneurinibacillus tyrosinisolvens TaxID=1443435 RepID=UPI00063F722B|nr:TVP38/TMEM64 family protein [Aneurinibacillus tyrosinisolvens]